MKLSNGEIFDAWEALNKLTPEGVKFPVRVSLGIVKLRTALRDFHQEIEEVKNGLVKTYGKANPENPHSYSVDPGSENLPKFVEEMEELMNQGVEVVIAKVKLPEKVSATCDKCNHNMDKMLEIEPSVLMALEKFVEVE